MNSCSARTQGLTNALKTSRDPRRHPEGWTEGLGGLLSPGSCRAARGERNGASRPGGRPCTSCVERVQPWAPAQTQGDATHTCHLPPPPGPALTSAGPARPGLGPGQRTHHAAGSYSAQTRMNSSRWCGPRMDESRVRYSKLSMITATKRFSICTTGRGADGAASDTLSPTPRPAKVCTTRSGWQRSRTEPGPARPPPLQPGRLCPSPAAVAAPAQASLRPNRGCSPQRLRRRRAPAAPRCPGGPLHSVTPASCPLVSSGDCGGQSLLTGGRQLGSRSSSPTRLHTRRWRLEAHSSGRCQHPRRCATPRPRPHVSSRPQENALRPHPLLLFPPPRCLQTCLLGTPRDEGPRGTWPSAPGFPLSVFSRFAVLQRVSAPFPVGLNEALAQADSTTGGRSGGSCLPATAAKATIHTHVQARVWTPL